MPAWITNEDNVNLFHQHKWYCPCRINLQGQTVRQAYYAEILKHLWYCTLHKSLLDHPFYLLHFALDNLWLVFKISAILKGKKQPKKERKLAIEDIQKTVTSVLMAIPTENIQNTRGNTWNHYIAPNVTYLEETILS